MNQEVWTLQQGRPALSRAWTFPIIATVVALVAASPTHAAAPPGYWHVRPSPVSVDLHGVTYGAGRYVAVGLHGTVLISQDGGSWVPAPFAGSDSLRCVTFANGLFVAGGEDGALLSISPDGVHWTNILSAAGATLAGIVADGGRFVAVGSVSSEQPGVRQGYSATSTDGVTWHTAALPVNPLRAVAFGNGLFVAVGEGAAIVTSPDGLSWEPRGSPITNDQNAVACCGGAQFVSSGMFGYSLSSSDGFGWIEVSRASFSVRALVSGGNYAVAVGRSEDTGRIHMTDGFGWPGENLIFPSPLNAVTFGNNNWVAVGEQGIIVQTHVPRLTLLPASGQVDLHLTGPPGTYRIERSADLNDWMTVMEVTLPSPPEMQYLMRADDPLEAHAYYRASYAP